MRRSILLLAGAAVLAAILSGPASAQGAPQTVANVTVGTIDDLIVTPNEKVPYAVLSVGGFLGMGTKYVVVSFSSLEVNNKRMMLRGATKESLKSLPEFHYSTQ